MNKLFLKICLALIVVSIGTTHAQIFTNFNTSNGLPDDYVSGGVAIDTNNNKWFGTAAGVAKYNDTTWTIYTTSQGLIDNNTNCIAVDKNNNIWVGTNSGVSKFNGNTWTSYTSSNGLADNNVYYIACDIDGCIWFATYNGTSRLNGSTWTTFTTSNGLPSNSINFITVDASGNKWFGTQMGGMSKYDNTTFTNFTTNDSLMDMNVFAIACDSGGNKWVGTWYGMSKFDNSDNWVANYRSYNGLFNEFIRDIDADAKGNVWIGMFADYNQEGAITRLNGNDWTTYTVNDGLVNKQIIRMAVDKQCNLWIATGGGVSKLTIYSGINEYKDLGYITTYPNPASDKITVKFNDNSPGNGQLIELYNCIGQKIYGVEVSQNISEITIPLNNCKNGIYYIKYNEYMKKIIICK